MYQRLFRLLLLITMGLALALAVWSTLPPFQVSAQCGTGTSCKTCHEARGKMRVNTKGEWHIQHSFGDFCAYCHGGNIKTMDKTLAHKGMIKPLENVNATCIMCHETDCATLAEKYGKTLGVTVSTGSGGAPLGPAPLLPFVPRVAGVGDQPPSLLQAQSPFAQPSAESSGGEPADEQGVNWGNVVLAVVAFVLLLGGGGFVVWNERRLMTGWDKTINARPELQELLPLLAQADPQTVRVITQTLAKRGK